MTIGGVTHPVPDAVLRRRHAEPDRERGRVPAARRPARPVHDEDRPRPPDAGRGDGDHRPHGRRTRRIAEQVIDLDGLDRPAAQGRRRVRRPQRRPVRRRPRPGHAQPGDRSASASCEPSIGLGASPRASLNLVRGARALALLRGRTYATPQDVFDVAPEVLRHRLLLTYDALARDITPDHDRQPHPRDRAGDVGVAEAERTPLRLSRELPLPCRLHRPGRAGRPGRRPSRSPSWCARSS